MMNLYIASKNSFPLRETIIWTSKNIIEVSFARTSEKIHNFSNIFLMFLDSDLFF